MPTNQDSTLGSARPDIADTSEGSIVHYLFEPGNGGLDRVAIYLANGMAERGIRTELWLSRQEGPAAQLISDKVTVRLVPTVSFGKRGLKLFLQIPALARMIRDHRPRGIFSAGNQSNLTIAIARRLVRGSKTKVIQKITNPVIRPLSGKFSAFIRTIRFRITALLGDRCLVLSEADARRYATLMPSVAERFRAVRNPYVSDEMIALGDARRPPEEGGRPCSLISVGRLEEQKDHATLFRALARLQHLSWQLRIFGNGPLEPGLRSLASELGIAERIVFEGFSPDLTSEYAKSDLLVLSSRWEGLPAVPFEALACGCDVVTTACSEGLTEELAPLGYRSVAVGDDGALAGAVEEAIERSDERPGKREIAMAYSISRSVDAHLQHLTDLVERS